METKEVSGEVQNIRKDRKAIEIEDIWYQSNFKPIQDDINKGDNVKIVYNEKGEFKNVKSIEILDLDEETEKIEEKDTKLKVNDSTINTLVMVSKDIFISQDIAKKSLKEVTTDVINSYKQIVENIK